MKILFVSQNMISFVEKDADILKKEHNVREVIFRGLFAPWKIGKEILWCDVVFCWFGKLQAFFAVILGKIFGKKVVVVSGGDDVACVPDYHYGMFSSIWKKWCPLCVFKLADLVLAVSEFNLKETIKNAKVSSSRTRLIYHGFDLDFYKVQPNSLKEKVVITIGGVDWERTKRKGYDLFVKSAQYLPDVKFVLVGQWRDDAIEHLRNISSKNVVFTGFIKDSEVLKWLSLAKVYVQASFHEAFGCSVAEAMLCECVPVLSRKGALPEVGGDTALYIDKFEPEHLASKISEALNSDLGKQTRNRIINEFPLLRRQQSLLKAIDQL